MAERRGRKPAIPEKPISLKPLTPTEALEGLLQTPPPPKATSDQPAELVRKARKPEPQ